MGLIEVFVNIAAIYIPTIPNSEAPIVDHGIKRTYTPAEAPRLITYGRIEEITDGNITCISPDHK